MSAAGVAAAAKGIRTDDARAHERPAVHHGSPSTRPPYPTSERVVSEDRSRLADSDVETFEIDRCQPGAIRQGEGDLATSGDRRLCVRCLTSKPLRSFQRYFTRGVPQRGHTCHACTKRAAGFRKAAPSGPPTHVRDLARSAVSKAVREGEIPRPTECAICGAPKRKPGDLRLDHYAGWTDGALDVVPLCRRCDDGLSVYERRYLVDRGLCHPASATARLVALADAYLTTHPTPTTPSEAA